MCRGLTGFWCTDGYAVCGYAEAAGTSKDIVVSVDEVGVSKTPGLRVNAPPSAQFSADSNRLLGRFGDRIGRMLRFFEYQESSIGYFQGTKLYP